MSICTSQVHSGFSIHSETPEHAAFGRSLLDIHSPEKPATTTYGMEIPNALVLPCI